MAQVARVAGLRHRLATVALGACLVPFAAAQDPAGREAAERTPLAWLQAIQQAAGRLSYSGVIVYQTGDSVRASRIVHHFDGTTSHERLLALDGRRREVLRSGEETVCLYPDARRKVIDRGGRRDRFPSLGASQPAELLAALYRLEVGAVERVAGRSAQVLGMHPRDRMRFGYRLWADRDTGLLLKAQTLGERQEVLEQVAFTEVAIGPADQRALQPSWPSNGWQVEVIDATRVELARHGWSLNAPEGFRRMEEVLRNVEGSGPPTLQAVWSDGIATISVFIEPGDPDGGVTPQLARRGPIHSYSRRVGSATVTAVGEVPAAAVRMIVESASYRPQ